MPIPRNVFEVSQHCKSSQQVTTRTVMVFLRFQYTQTISTGCLAMLGFFECRMGGFAGQALLPAAEAGSDTYTGQAKV